VSPSTGRILVSGASGLIGSAVVQATAGRSIEAVRLVRDARLAGPDAIAWNPDLPENAVDPALLGGFGAVVHLSGANVGRRWTSRYKQEILSSRVNSTQALCRALAATQDRPRVLLCASAVGIYGNRGDEMLTEQSTPGSGFLADTCVAWEVATQAASDAGIRVVHLRFGIVLDGHGGALPRMLPAFRLGLGGKLGSGDQWVSWISLRDAVRAIFFLVDSDRMAGAFNLTAPNPMTNRTFSRAIGKAIHRPAVLPVPRAAVRVLLGEFADEALLASQRAIPERLVEAGFAFENLEIEATLTALLG
jgi:uncharacterized protein (TIGR01777 family)